MIKVDLITGFLGSGKTTFIRKYARFLIESGLRVGILENDYGAVNVDVMLLGELEGERCGIESVAGACDADCHRRRFKTKLIALAMSGCDRVIVEPSGIFDVDEFYDSLCEPPLDRWYEIGSVIAVADADLSGELSQNSSYLLASQIAGSGTLALSRVQEVTPERVSATVAYINEALREFGCRRELSDADILAKDWSTLDNRDFERLSSCGFFPDSFPKLSGEHGYRSLYFMNTALNAEKLKSKVKSLFENPSFGGVFRVKGFFAENGSWFELNATQKSLSISPIKLGQDIIIVIGEELNESAIKELFGN